MNLLKILPLNETKLKILLEIYSAGEDYLRSIEKKTGINPSLLHRVLKQLEKSGVVSKEKKGKENYYSLSKEK
ncbi:MAG: winged helix-turn-helix domain-containing protein, partial [Nanoarchaeota archaeon]|nr:winged helix-turn-helix domain-containing protein [Nanoarchaeota archaeon]